MKRAVLFTHSLESDWNHGNAHFLRGFCTELGLRNVFLRVFEPSDAWSRRHLVADYGLAPLVAYRRAYPAIPHSEHYTLDTLDLDEALAEADVVLVHEWNDPELVARIGEHRRRRGGYRLLFHDTHHRSVTAPHEMARYDLTHYDGVLAFGETVRREYLRHGWARAVWTFHEAADTRVFRPVAADRPKQGDLVWIGNWGDDERSAELREFLIEPVRRLGLRARVYGVRYPDSALRELADAGIEYGGWLPNFEAPKVFAEFRVTVHVPRRPYASALAGVPTIRPFEALACGIPLISAPWRDVEGLFRVGEDFRMAANGDEMCAALGEVLRDAGRARQMVSSGLETIASRHTCAHRLDQLLGIVEECESRAATEPALTGEA